MQSVECDHDDGAGETIHRVFPLSEVLLLQCPGHQDTVPLYKGYVDRYRT